MWSRLTLKTRLMLLFAVLLAAGMAADVTLALRDAGPRVAAEDESSMKLALDFIESAAPALDAAPDPQRALGALVKSLRHLRHITVSLRGDPAATEPARETGAEAGRDVPAWFVGLISPAAPSTGVDIVSGGQPIGTIVIAAEPLDEIGEIWDGIAAQFATGSAVAITLLALTFLTVGRALAPVADLLRAMRLIGEGRYDIRVAPSGPPELGDMCRQMNALAAVLGSTIDEKQRLAERLVTLQDDERRDLARELHDEFGPYLFAIRAQVAALRRAGSDPDVTRAIGEQVDALQASNRRVLRSLRPVALDDLGLEAALAALIDGVQDSRPALDIDVDITAGADLRTLGDTASLTVYRVVQEALTNVLRHADATQARIAVDRTDGGRVLRIRVADNGIGMPDPLRDGLGLTGMKERLAVLGGSLDLRSSRQEGTRVEAAIPLTGRTAG